MKDRAFDGPLGAWAYKVSVNSVWRVFPHHDLDDLMGEARLVFWQCQVRYGDKAKNDAHFASLFRRAFINRIHSWANRRTRKPSVAESALTPVHRGRVLEDGLFSYLPSYQQPVLDAEVKLLIQEAPPSVKRVLKALIPSEEPTGAGVYYIGRGKKGRSGKRPPEPRKGESTNDFLCRLAGKDPESTNMVRKICRWLGQDEVQLC